MWSLKTSLQNVSVNEKFSVIKSKNVWLMKTIMGRGNEDVNWEDLDDAYDVAD